MLKPKEQKPKKPDFSQVIVGEKLDALAYLGNAQRSIRSLGHVTLVASAKHAGNAMTIARQLEAMGNQVTSVSLGEKTITPREGDPYVVYQLGITLEPTKQ